MTLTITQVLTLTTTQLAYPETNYAVGVGCQKRRQRGLDSKLPDLRSVGILH